MADFSVRQADANELGSILSLLRHAARWLCERRIDYWQNWLDPPEAHVRWLQGGLERGELYIVEQAGATIGCYRLQWSDEMFWGKRDDEAGYIHSLTIRRDLAGQGVGRRVLDRIAALCREKSKLYLRLDCGSHVEGLLRYYNSCGFERVGETTVYGERLTLLEKRL